MPDRKITSVKDLVTELDQIQKGHRNPAWFRGQAKASWGLLPSFHRLTKPVTERDLLDRFRQNANQLLPRVPAAPYGFEWLFFMQHYGVPTRLLDWTESPLIALYFAVYDSKDHDSHAGAVWALWPHELNKNSTQAANYVPSFEDEWLLNYTPEQVHKAKDLGILPLAATAARNNPRIQAQLGVFTISHTKNIAIEKVGNREHCTKLVVPGRSKPRIREELRLLGLTRLQLFPELDSLGIQIRESIK